MKIEIRFAESFDSIFVNEGLFRLCDMHHQAISDKFKPARELIQTRNFEQYFTSKTAFILIAQKEPNPVGFTVGVVWQKTDQNEAVHKEVEIFELFVEDSARKLGAARGLINRAEEIFVQKRVPKLYR